MTTATRTESNEGVAPRKIDVSACVPVVAASSTAIISTQKVHPDTLTVEKSADLPLFIFSLEGFDLAAKLHVHPKGLESLAVLNCKGTWIAPSLLDGWHLRPIMGASNVLDGDDDAERGC